MNIVDREVVGDHHHPDNEETSRYDFVRPQNVVFFVGAPLVGKSTIVPRVAERINDAPVQHMDVIRLLAESFEEKKPEDQRQGVVFLGSTTAYQAIGDGSFSTNSLIEGYKKYSEAVSEYLFPVLDRLNPEDVNNLLVEGVYFLPELIAPYLEKEGYSLVLLLASPEDLEAHRSVVFNRKDHEDNYPIEHVVAIQDEILRQSQAVPQEKVLRVSNKSIPEAVSYILKGLVSMGVIE